MFAVKKYAHKAAVKLFGAAFLINLIIEFFSRWSLIDLAFHIGTSPLAFLYNTMIITFTLSLAYFFKRRYFAGCMIGIVWVLLGLTNGIILLCRVTPFCFTDILLISDAIKIVDKYFEWWYLIFAAIGIVGIVAGMIYLWKKFPVPEQKAKPIRTLFFSVTLLFAVLISNEVGQLTGFLTSNFANIASAYKEYGFVCCFTYGIFDTGIDKPTDYDKDKVDEIVDEITVPNDENVVKPGDSDSADKLPNIIYVQLESLFDVTKMEGIELNRDPLKNLHYLMDYYTSGNLLVPVIGAGTANTEFEIITGMNLDFFGPGEYPYKTLLKDTTCESMCFNMEPYGYTSHAIHNNTATFYGRDKVFPQLGFDTFTASEYMQNITYNETGYIKDKVLTAQIINAIESTPGNDLIYTISVQGHGSYPTEDIVSNKVIEVSGFETEERNHQFEYYCNQMYQMDQFVGNLVEALKKTNEKCVLVLYGDHLPSLGITEEELGGESLFHTPLVIWDNFGMVKENITLEAYQLSAYVMDRLNLHGGVMTQYHQNWLDQLVKLDLTKLTDKNSEESKLYEEYLNKLEIMEYDTLYGDQESTGGENPYVATDMQFGVMPIDIESITYNSGSLYVYGENFTSASRVMVDGEMLETLCILEDFLAVRDFEIEDGSTVCVVQYAEKDNAILSKTPDYTMKLSWSISLTDPEE